MEPPVTNKVFVVRFDILEQLDPVLLPGYCIDTSRKDLMNEINFGITGTAVLENLDNFATV